MNALLLLALTSIGYWVAYHTYGKFLAKKIFQINPKQTVPSHALKDGKDYHPSSKHIMFGHHFTSIAGTGPIVGPAIGVIWGWVPAVIWIFVGSIFMGAVHDFGTLIVSVRNEGKSISEIARVYINDRVRTYFFIVVCLALLIVIAIFGLVIALIFSQFPQAVFPVWAEIPIAIALGSWAFKGKLNIKWATLAAVALMYVTVGLGVELPFTMPDVLGIPSTGVWTLILLVYAYIASVLPVSVLLQPRDYINAWQLYVALGLIVVGIVVTGLSQPLTIPAPAFNLNPEGAPALFPFLFITIACGAISGFHSLVSSGTSSKQLDSEADAQFIGYGAMVTEAFLATLVLVAVTAGLGLAYTTASGEVLTGLSAWQAHYSSWVASAGLGSKLTAVVVGCANFMASIGISPTLGAAIVGVFIASFAGTTLDSATRVQRYVISELLEDTPLKRYNNKHVATTIAVVTAALLAFSSGVNGKGALALWPMFGAVNQLLAGLALMVVTAYLHQKKRPIWYTAIPCFFVMIMTLWASFENQKLFFESGNVTLCILNGIIALLAVLMTLETIRLFFGKKSCS